MKLIRETTLTDCEGNVVADVIYDGLTRIIFADGSSLDVVGEGLRSNDIELRRRIEALG